MAPRPLSIAVIGAGPSGLFFCNALEHKFRKTGREFDVTCFERSSQAGGVWRASDPNTANAPTSTDMYEQLWTNGASHLNEFFDYTYDQHFGKPVNVYMNRQDLLEYILGRVTHNCPEFFDKYVQFQTEVQHVVFDDIQQQFAVTTHNLATEETTTRYFDKCVWACGENGTKNMPEPLVRIFDNFAGRLLHSADTKTLLQDVRHKRILLVGGGFSAEDLALQAIKLGAEKVFVSVRDPRSEVTWTKNWPMDKVEVLLEQAPCGVTEDGRCIQFGEYSWTPYGYKRCGNYVETELRDIDTVILATGYHVNLSMLDPSLAKGYPSEDHKTDKTLKIAEDWKMPDNEMTEYTGEVEVADTVRFGCSWCVHPELYQGVLIDNPNMMFVSSYGSHEPLVACDASAWLMAGYATGDVNLPSPEEMRSINETTARNMMNIPYFRYLMDDNYWKAVDELEDFWPDDPDERCEAWDEVEYEEFVLSIKRLAGVMQEAKYPISIGTSEKLNEKGNLFLEFGMLGWDHRDKLVFKNADEKQWKTFRDVVDADKFFSMFTGTKAVPHDKRWMDTKATSKDVEAFDEEKKIDT